MFRTKTVGIFTREDAEVYKWLTDCLLDLSCVKNTESFPISNSNWSFKEDVNKCTFAILYHSQTRGRINVTDVTDSLYDKELDYLSNTLGKSNVIVIIDNLDDSNDNAKERIQSEQKSIKEKAAGLFLFSKNDTNTYLKNLLEIEQLIKRSFQITDPPYRFQTETATLGCWLKSMPFLGLTALVLFYILGVLYYNIKCIPW
ncbi:uncharacterized protein LOC121398246 [Xenopus laevis]|uniref:Uncharacterized protein LOC121398246 n=2 Tax=Xenopus laevis TaxID=8355 RepID=A0A1L8EZA5_XENLA|nr:uncharacterized protein LOC121398246 [Xenopus laevis]OCT64704.1 hypothetical protein XELAEV_18045801mg [Xenopus laevis]